MNCSGRLVAFQNIQFPNDATRMYYVPAVDYWGRPGARCSFAGICDVLQPISIEVIQHAIVGFVKRVHYIDRFLALKHPNGAHDTGFGVVFVHGFRVNNRAPPMTRQVLAYF